MAYEDLKDLNRRAAADKAFNIAKNSKYDGYQFGLALMVQKHFNKKTFGGIVKNKIIYNKELVEKLHKLIIRNFEKRKVLSSFIDNIWCTYLADMQWISKFNKGFSFLLVLLIFIANMHWLFL